MTHGKNIRTSEPTSTSSPLSTGLLQRKCACGQYMVAGEECSDCKKNRLAYSHKASDLPTISNNTASKLDQPLVTLNSLSFRIQTKLTVNEPGDVYEREADAIAEKVMRMSAVGEIVQPAYSQDYLVEKLQRQTSDNLQHPELPLPKRGEKPLSYKHIEGQAFVRGVKSTDVKQLGLPACGLLAALSALAAVHPKKIEENIQHKGGDQWDVLLYSKKGPEWIRVNQDLPVTETGDMALVSGTEAELKVESIEPLYENYETTAKARLLTAELYDPVLTKERKKEIQSQLESMRTGWTVTYVPDMKKRELWPALYIKAIAILVAKYQILQRRGSKPGGYDDLQGIGMEVATEIITGQPAKLIESSDVSEDELFTVMNKAWLNDQPVTAGSLSSDGNVKKEKIGNTGIYYDHAYIVLRTWKPEGKPVLDLQNPHGDPEFRLGFRQFKQLFDSVAIGSQQVKRVLQRAAVNTAPLTQVPSIVFEVLRSLGQPLDMNTRAFMEPRFGQDFSQVRVHTDAKAAESAIGVNALAYTVGRDVVFAKGRHQPETNEGRRLIAHELTHVVQQMGTNLKDSGLRLQRQSVNQTDEFDKYIRAGDWHGAAWNLAQSDTATIASRVKKLSSTQRQYLVEGARHGEGHWNTEAIISIVDQISHRDALIGSVRFYVWKRQWGQVGLYMCGLNDADIRRQAIALRLTIRDLQAIVDEQTDPVQKTRLSSVLFSSEIVLRPGIPKDLIGRGSEQLVEMWLVSDPVVGPYAEKKFKTGVRLGHFHIVPVARWTAVYAELHGIGQSDPDVQRKAALAMGFNHRGEIYLREGEESPGTVIHEAIHSLATEDFRGLYGTSVNEGATEFFARRVARSVGQHPPAAYREEYSGVAALATVAGEQTVADAFFGGKTFQLVHAIDDKKGRGKFSAWLDAMKDDNSRSGAPAIFR